jgi:hypothetical protein
LYQGQIGEIAELLLQIKIVPSPTPIAGVASPATATAPTAAVNARTDMRLLFVLCIEFLVISIDPLLV